MWCQDCSVFPPCLLCVSRRLHVSWPRHCALVMQRVPGGALHRVQRAVSLHATCEPHGPRPASHTATCRGTPPAAHGRSLACDQLAGSAAAAHGGRVAAVAGDAAQRGLACAVQHSSQAQQLWLSAASIAIVLIPAVVSHAGRDCELLSAVRAGVHVRLCDLLLTDVCTRDCDCC